ncbi:Transferase [Trema orientale]|uniref:Transferase n=1 Tax=Trema orientale TaxID=63057 RepID=A0A2P5BDN6_TREOI|nr:Transferase [Trema orientale]
MVGKQATVKSKPVPPGKYFPPSVLDRPMEMNHIRMVFYYPKMMMMQEETGHVNHVLRISLSELLTNYPAVTGRLLRNDEDGQWMNKCNRTVAARAQGSVEDWLKCVDKDKEPKLVYYWEELGNVP